MNVEMNVNKQNADDVEIFLGPFQYIKITGPFVKKLFLIFPRVLTHSIFTKQQPYERNRKLVGKELQWFYFFSHMKCIIVCRKY
jgi:hypothetical protein